MYSTACRDCAFYPRSMCYYCMMRTAPPYAYPFINHVHRHESLSKRYRAEEKKFTTAEALKIAQQLGVDFRKFDVEQFRMGLDVELEHGTHDSHTNVTDDDPIMTGKIALAHLNEFPDYYTRLYKMEEEAEAYWEQEESE